MALSKIVGLDLPKKKSWVGCVCGTMIRKPIYVNSYSAQTTKWVSHLPPNLLLFLSFYLYCNSFHPKFYQKKHKTRFSLKPGQKWLLINFSFPIRRLGRRSIRQTTEKPLAMRPPNERFWTAENRFHTWNWKELEWNS